MKIRAPRAHALFIAATLAATVSSPAQEPTDAEREKILAEIEEIRTLLDGGIVKNNARAIAAFQAAMNSPKETYNLFMECVEEVEYRDVGKSGTEWREWRERNEDNLKDSGHIKARQFQLRYLVLTLKATSGEKEDEALKSNMAGLISFYDDLAANYDSMSDYRYVLRESVTDSVFAKRGSLDITINKDRSWNFSPINVSSTYDKTILPYYRRLEEATALKSAWDKRILHEGKLISTSGSRREAGVAIPESVEGLMRRFRRGGGRRNDDDRDERKEDNRQKEQAEKEFMEKRLPELQWGRSRDAYFYGSAKTATLAAMNRHIRANLKHPSAQKWLKEVESFARGESDPDAFYKPKTATGTSSGSKPDTL